MDYCSNRFGSLGIGLYWQRRWEFNSRFAGGSSRSTFDPDHFRSAHDCLGAFSLMKSNLFCHLYRLGKQYKAAEQVQIFADQGGVKCL